MQKSIKGNKTETHCCFLVVVVNPLSSPNKDKHLISPYVLSLQHASYTIHMKGPVPAM